MGKTEFVWTIGKWLIQQKIIEIWPSITTENLNDLTSFEMYQEEF